MAALRVIPTEGLPASKREALAAGSRYFMPAEPCANGHLSPRAAYINRSRCVECKRAGSRRAKAKSYQKDTARHREESRIAQAAKRASGTDWGTRNPEAFAAMKSAWKRNNRDKVRASAIRRKAVLLRAQPSWLTESHRAQIAEFYRLAVDMTETTGIPHEVDHIFPLQGKVVCGLHVPWNLRVITAEKNNRRPRIWSPDKEPDLCL